jgi:hypothetical protein
VKGDSISDSIQTHSQTIQNENRKFEFSNKEFEEFYNRFILDSVFQIEHVRFPLDGSLNECDTTILWTKANWEAIHFDLRNDFYNPIDSNIVKQDNSIFQYECIREEIGLLCEMRFEKIGKEWYLIYYLENAC